MNVASHFVVMRTAGDGFVGVYMLDEIDRMLALKGPPLRPQQ
jgi:hypothetical protein